MKYTFRRYAIIILLFISFLFNGCILPDVRPVQFTFDLKQFETELTNRFKCEYVNTGARVQRQNGIDNHF